jgi:hypothetical protein
MAEVCYQFAPRVRVKTRIFTLDQHVQRPCEISCVSTSAQRSIPRECEHEAGCAGAVGYPKAVTWATRGASFLLAFGAKENGRSLSVNYVLMDLNLSFLSVLGMGPRVLWWRPGMAIPLPTLDLLQTLTIATPCTIPWERMTGDDRSRFCGECRRQVFDLSGMIAAEAKELIGNTQNTPCVRFYRRPDGRVMTSDCAVGIRTQVWKRLRKRAAWAASLFAILFLPACRSYTQGMPGDLYPETVKSLSSADQAPEATSTSRSPK